MTRNIVVGLVIILLVNALVYHFVISKGVTDEYQNGLAQRRIALIKDFETMLRQDRQAMLGVIAAIQADGGYQAALNQSNRQQLVNQGVALLAKLKAVNQISHFYFHDVTGRNLIRFHNLNQYGDAIPRYTLQQTMTTGQPVSGIEVGSHELLTHRVVAPFTDADGAITAYVELGKELGSILQWLQQHHNSHVFLLLETDLLQHKQNTAGDELLPDHDNDILPGYSIFGDSLDILRERPGMVKNLLQDPQVDCEFPLGDRHCHGYQLPLTIFGEMAGEPIDARVFVVADVTDLHSFMLADKRRLGYLVLAASLLVFVVIIYFYRNFMKTHTAVLEQSAKTSAQLNLAEIQQQTIINSLADALIMIDAQQLIRLFNPAAETMFGYSREEAIGQPITLLMNRDDADHHADYVRARAVGKGPTILGKGRILRGRRKDGSSFPIHAIVTELVADLSRNQADQDEKFYIGILRDLTESQRQEQLLLQSQKMEALGQLTGGIAHDFNNIVGIVSGNLELLRMKLEDDEGLTKRIDKALDTLHRASNLTQRLLQFSNRRLVAGEPIEVNEFIENLFPLLQEALVSGVSLSLNLTDHSGIIHANTSEFENSLLNLVINARDAMPQGGEIIISTRVVTAIEDLVPENADKPYVAITVADNGSGIPEDIREKILEPFYTTKEAGKGTGLGLSMIYGFVKRFQGFLKIDSEVGQGTQITLYLPQWQDSRQPALMDDSPQHRDLPKGSERILVVDDEKELASTTAEQLSALGYTVYMADAPYKALNFLDKHGEVDLLLSDVVMPGSANGFQLAAKVQQRFPNIKLLLMSGFTDGPPVGEEIPTELKQQLSNSLLSKPFTRLQLATAVRSVLDEVTSGEEGKGQL